MTSVHKLSLLSLAVLATLMAVPADAQESYYYGGFGIGQGRARIDDARISEALLERGFTTNSIAREERSSAYKIFGGYQVNRYLGVELGYFKLGTFGFTADASPAGTLNGGFRVKGFNLGVVGTLPITEKFSALGRVGIQRATTLGTLTPTGSVTVSDTRPSQREANAKVGLGLQYEFNPSVLGRVEAETFRVSDAMGNHTQVAMYTVGLVFPFGRSPAPARRAAAAPAYEPPAFVAQAPMVITETAPPPVAVVALEPATPLVAFAPPQSRRVSYAAESFFAFDRAELQPAGKSALDVFASQLEGSSYDNIRVQGHADRIGGATYNQTLSLARADAVKAYLVSLGRFDAARITTEGRSESEPVTLPDDCKGPMSTPVIACLQPDRRVEIEVSGTR
ncbi:Outer membrane protein A precursor [Rubrivivax sp. A210]|uniref:OmpA family protein n=1 Tax=Rubrivivax sp. A210 TaxID=2772301 RepID=UPI001917A509|nr:OmpA family protein [Rubrivivax sp. A210]CAD5365938.1 Outer membrane protein A precursor [Rubrivivax sp. A210]